MMSALIEELEEYYKDFLMQETGSLGSLYSDDVIFCDPLHRIEGLPALKSYFAGMSRGLTQCRFQFDDLPVVGEGSACLSWTMHYRHQSLKGGRPLQLRGCSLLRYTDKIHYHEDFYDMGAMVYEQVPVLGSCIGFIKSRMERN
ncbi:nuclear transport factor 2 family protein [Microbulbifer sp. MKSA007]|uniref:nuclear transport factor 2 family protein n=2 Tax=unclassified Microbulbifer TaxID=2619833 RepID=UPI0024ADF3E4|nr:nuclear transport factor 2 family protein [Microbulbifer sp. VAAF005]WHI47637.1 nuclear transport factor 2 family protein [Microbulbifer sp. VAAF005]WNZ58128.1 nuclear transport factor 2 family protein [Microbulbifer sp. MKSA007]